MKKLTVDLSGFGGGYEAMCQTMLWRGVAWWAEVKPRFEDVWPPLAAGEKHRKEDTPLAKELERAMIRPGEDATGAMFGAAISTVAYIAQHGVDKWIEDVRAVEPGRIYEADVILEPADSHREHATPLDAFNAGVRAAKRAALSLLALVLLAGCNGAKVTTVHWQMTAAPPDLRLAATEGELMNLAGVPLGVINCTAASVSPKADVTMGVAGCFKPNGELAFGGVTPGVSSWDAWLRGLGIAADFAQAGLTYGASVVIADGMKAAAKAIPREVTATTTGSVSTSGTVNVGAIPSVNVNPVTGSFDLVPVAP